MPGAVYPGRDEVLKIKQKFMKEYLSVFVLTVVAIVIGGLVVVHFLPKSQLGDALPQVFYTQPTQATTSVGTVLPVKVLANSGSRQYAQICNTSPTSTNDLLLEFDATSSATGLTNAPAMLVPSNSCYSMTPQNMFLGNLYGLYVNATATVETLAK